MKYLSRSSGPLAVALLLALALAPAAFAADQAAATSSRAGGRLAKARPAPQRVTLTGFTRARAEMALISEVAGRCLEVLADVGQAIAADGVFARLDATFTRLELESNQVEQSRLKSRVAYLKKELGRTRSLVKKKSQAQAKLDAEEQELAQAEMQLKALRVAARTLAERLTRHQIKAPPGWRVIARQVEPGQWVGSGAVVGRVGDFRTLLIPLALTPEELASLEALEKIDVALPQRGVTVPAVIERQSPAFDPTTRKLNLDLAIKGDNGNGGVEGMRGGLRVELTLMVPDPAGAVLVPSAALKERYQEHWLTRAGGERVAVVLLGPGPEGFSRVASPEVKPGQEFVVHE